MYNNQAGSPSGSITAGAVVGIVFAATIVIILVFGILWWKGCFGKKNYLARGDYKQTAFLVVTMELFPQTHGLFK